MKCGKCSRKAEFHDPDKAAAFFCEDHAVDYLKSGDVSFLPRLRDAAKEAASDLAL